MSPLEKKVNQLPKVFILSFLVLGALMALSLLPEDILQNYGLKKIDILSSLRFDAPPIAITPVDTSKIEIIAEEPIPEKVPGEVYIEDYGNIMSHFNKKVSSSARQQIRIAFYGDSFIEGDIISAYLRDSLQRKLGGSGVGLVPLASDVSTFRKSIKHEFNGWTTFSLINQTDTKVPLGISGYTFIPETDNHVAFKPGKEPYQKSFRSARLFFTNTGSVKMNYIINDSINQQASLLKSDSVAEFRIDTTGMASLQLQFEQIDSLKVYGISFEDKTGIYVDNFSMRRNSGVALSKLSLNLAKEMNQHLDYKLIILQYGLNVASETDTTNYSWYYGRMVRIVNDFKNTFPNTSILLLSVSDRGVNKDGKVVTMPGILKLREVQKKIAKECKIAYWDMFAAMGGENSIAAFTNATPALAAKDYTHLTHLGGKIIGKKLAGALLQKTISK